MNVKEEAQGLENLYKERSKFVIIGLTGRTGSGCSTAAEILRQNFNSLGLPHPQNANFSDNEERKYKIIYDYMAKHWSSFYVVSIRDVITSFILDIPFDDFWGFVIRLISPEDSEKIPEKLETILKLEYETFFEKRKKVKEMEEVDKEEKEIKTKKAFEFYFDELPDFTKRLQEVMNQLSQGVYLKIYQILGDNIRASGNPIDNQFNPNSIFSIASRTNKIIKVIRKEAERENRNALIAIDAFRNTFEVQFFRDRYSAFYLASVNTPNEARIYRLQNNQNLNFEQVKELDKKEYPFKLKGYQKFISQNIQKCIELSDIHLNNPQLGQADTSLLKKQLAWYISLILHPGLVTPSPLERCMQIAYGAKLNSGCISRQVGATITDQNYSIKSVGWNNTPEGQVPCLLRSAEKLVRFDDKKAFSDYENNDVEFRKAVAEIYQDINDEVRVNVLQGRNTSFCFKDLKNNLDGEKNQVHTRSLHAEENAFLQLAKYGGEGIKGGTLFTTASPCELCAKKAYQLGIQKIIYIDPYPGIADSHILKSGSLKPELELFHGAIGRAYHQLYQPILPFKDELAMLIRTEPSKMKTDLQAENEKLKSMVEEQKREIEKLKQHMEQER